MAVRPFFDTAKERSYAERTLHIPPAEDMLLQRVENLAAAMLRACDEIETQRMTLEYVLRHLEHGSTYDRAVIAEDVRRTLHYKSGAAGRYPVDQSSAELPGSRVRSRVSRAESRVCTCDRLPCGCAVLEGTCPHGYAYADGDKDAYCPIHGQPPLPVSHLVECEQCGKFIPAFLDVSTHECK